MSSYAAMLALNQTRTPIDREAPVGANDDQWTRRDYTGSLLIGLHGKVFTSKAVAAPSDASLRQSEPSYQVLQITDAYPGSTAQDLVAEMNRFAIDIDGIFLSSGESKGVHVRRQTNTIAELNVQSDLTNFKPFDLAGNRGTSDESTLIGAAFQAVNSWLAVRNMNLLKIDKTPAPRRQAIVFAPKLFGDWQFQITHLAPDSPGAIGGGPLTSSGKSMVGMPAWTSPWTYSAEAATRDLQAWLGLSVDDVAKLIGASRSAVLYWRREQAEPRPTVARNLVRVHALVRALRRVTTEVGFKGAIHARPIGWNHSAFDLLMAGNYDRAEDLLRSYLFTSNQPARPSWASQIGEWPHDALPDHPRQALQLKTPVKATSRVKLRRID